MDQNITPEQLEATFKTNIFSQFYITQVILTSYKSLAYCSYVILSTTALPTVTGGAQAHGGRIVSDQQRECHGLQGHGVAGRLQLHQGKGMEHEDFEQILCTDWLGQLYGSTGMPCLLPT